MAPKPTANAVDKLLFIPKVFIILASAFSRLAKVSIFGGPRAKTLFKDFVWAALRANLTWVSVKQEIWLNPTTENGYLEASKAIKGQPDIQVLPSGLKLFWFGPRDAEKTIFYLHGGGYVLSCSPGHFKWIAGLQKDLGAQTGKSVNVVVVGYTLAPMGQYPKQLQEAAESLSYLLEDMKKKPEDIIIAGDSAGGNLALALISHILHPHSSVAHKIPQETSFAGLILISPWSKFAVTDASATRNAQTDMVTTTAATRWSQLFLGPAKSDSYNEPELAPDTWFQGLEGVVKGVFLWGGGGELLIDGIRNMRRKLERVHEGVVYVEEEGAAHEDMIMSLLVGYTEKSEGTKALEGWAAKLL